MHHRSLTKGLKIIQVFSFFCFLALVYFMYQVPLKTLYFTIPFILLTILYAIPFLSGFDKNLREVSNLKIVVVAFVWAGFTVFIPLIDAGKEISLDIVFLMLQRFLIVIVLILPFDIRDVNYDAFLYKQFQRKLELRKQRN